MYHIRPLSLQELCLHACFKMFSRITFTPPKEILDKLHRYLAILPPSLIGRVAKICRYHFSGSKTLLFIPFLLNNGHLIITDENIDQVILWTEHLSSLNQMDTISNLKMLSVNVPKPENYFKFLPFVSKVPNIVKLVLNSWTNDDILAAIGMNCKNLEILDARGDADTAVTDIGLGFLSHCKTLKIVLFSNIADEYDYEDKLKFTGKGISLLLLSLPNLERLECPEYLLRDSLHYIYQMNFLKSDSNRYLGIKNLYLAYPDVPDRTVNLLPFLCPYLETLSLYIPKGKESILKPVLRRLSHLKSLKLKFEAACIDVLSILDCNQKVDYLIIDTQYLQEIDICYLSIVFPSLTTLCLCIHSFGFVPMDLDYYLKLPDLYPNLHTLQLEQRISGKLFEVINIKLQNLRELYLKRAVIYDIEKAVKNVISNGGWKNLKILIFPQNCTFCASFCFVNIAHLVNLKFLCVKFPCDAEESLFKAMVLDHLDGRLQLCNDDDFPEPNKIFTAI